MLWGSGAEGSGAEGSGTTLDGVVKDRLSVEVTLEPSPDPQGRARLRKVLGRRPQPRT